MSTLLDHYLLFRVRTKRDPEAFARLYDRYVEAIYRFAALKLPSIEDAQDVTSETFTRTWKYLNEQEDVINVRALLYRIARNLIADHYRKAEPTVSIEAVTFTPQTTSTPVREPPDSDKGRERQIIEARADSSLIILKLERLKEDYRDVLTLRLVEDLPFDIIADILDKKVGHIRVIYHRAIKALNQIEN
jgi:RNA polymerase sigma-70 factor (ECF subfamily)